MGDKSKKDKDKGQKQERRKAETKGRKKRLRKQPKERCLTEALASCPGSARCCFLSAIFCALDSFFIAASRFKAMEGSGTNFDIDQAYRATGRVYICPGVVALCSWIRFSILLVEPVYKVLSEHSIM